MHLLELVAALGAVQGLLLFVLIGFRYRSRCNMPLALLLFAFAMRLGTIPAWTPEGLLAARWMLPVAGAAPLLFGPLVWWYVRELIREELDPPRLMPLHAVPWALETVALSVVILALDQAAYRALVDDLFTRPAPWWMPARHAVKALLGTVYAALSIRIAFGRESRAVHVTATRRIWARLVVGLPLLCLVSFLVIAVRPAAPAITSAGADLRFYAPAVAMMLTVYAFSLMVLFAPDVLTGTRKNRMDPLSVMDESEISWIERRLREELENGVYRDTELTITRLAQRIGVQPYRLSLVINRAFGRNFSQLMHDYRLEFFLERARAGDLERYTTLRVATEAGFPSKTTFHRVFRERFGTSPGEYVEQLGADVAGSARPG